MAEQTALVTIAPDDSIDAIIQQVKKAGASHVDVLTPDGSPALQSRKACDKLREMANRDSIDLTVYTADPKIVRAAQNCQIMVVELDETALAPAGGPPAPAATPAPPPPPATPAKPLSREEDFLLSLEDVPAAPAAAGALRGAKTMDIEQPSFADRTPEDDWASALDSFSAASIGGEQALREHAREKGDDSWDFDSFNDLSDVINGGESSAAPARPRIRPEDIELTSDDKNRQLPKSKRAQAEKKEKGRRGPKVLAPGEVAPPRRNNASLLIALLLLLAAVALGVWWFFIRQPVARIIVQPPAAQSGQQTYDDVRIIFQPDLPSDPTSAAIQGRVVEAPVSVTVRGTVLTPTLQPDKTAVGSLVLINRNTQEYSLPAGSRVRTLNPNGEEVSYLTTENISVPPATSTLTGVAFGQTQVPITASAPGEAFNLPPDEITGWTVEGYEGGMFGVNPAPISGGTNTLLKIPTEADIRPLLNQAVPQFKQAVPSQLQALLTQGEQLTSVEFTPPISALVENPGLYDIQTRPVAETDGDFELIVTANFRGLAAPTAYADQVMQALPKALYVKSNQQFNPETMDIVSYTLRLNDDPNVNLLIGTVQTQAKDAEPLPQATRQQIAQALQGLTADQARQKLADFAAQGLIGQVVEFPQIEQLPADASQIEIVVP